MSFSNGHTNGNSLPPELEAKSLPHPTLPNQEYGAMSMTHYPAVLDGTNGDVAAEKFKPKTNKTDVIIVGAGPSGLEVAASLARQGFSSRIIDKSPHPLVVGRGNGVQPRFLEIAQLWGLQSEFTEVGPIIEHTAIYMDGECKLYAHTHQSESPFKGLHLVTQPQIERIMIRDLRRHSILVERPIVMDSFAVSKGQEYPVTCQLKNVDSGVEETVHAKFLVGADGAHSSIRRTLDISFNGMTADIFWGVLDAPLESDWPHAWMFGLVLHSKHGGVCIVPRENGIVRLYVQLRPEPGKKLDKASITPEDVLEVANRCFAPYTIRFKGPQSWHLVWQISERVAEAFSAKDCVFLVGDACHCHSAMGAFGLNAGIMDTANVAWKIGMCLRKAANPDILLPTYDSERRIIANRLVRTSARYLRIVTMEPFAKTAFNTTVEEELGEEWQPPKTRPDGTPCTETDIHFAFLMFFLKKNARLLIGLDIPYRESAINKNGVKVSDIVAPGLRAPNPRVALGVSKTGYLYHALQGNPGAIHILVFAGYLNTFNLASLDTLEADMHSDDGFYSRFSHQEVEDKFPVSKSLLHIVLLVRCLPQDSLILLDSKRFPWLSKYATLVLDDSLPPEDAHSSYGISQVKGGVVLLRPDAWIGTTTTIERAASDVASYLAGWMIPAGR